MQISTAKAKKSTFNIFKVEVDHSINVMRFVAGQSVHGVTVNDSLDLETMRTQIRDAGGILEPVYLNKSSDGKVYVFRGFRRTSAAQTMEQMKDTPQGLIEALKETPCFMFEGLTREEMMLAVNDQSTKKFKTSGVINWIWTMADQGKGFRELAPIVWEHFESWPSKKMQGAIKSIEAMPIGVERTKAAQDALKGCLDQEILLAHQMGERVQTAYLLPFLVTDGLADPKLKPEFKVNRDILSKLLKAKDADKASPGGWNAIDGGAAFNALIEQEVSREPKKANGSKRPKPADVDELFGKLQSKLGQKVSLFVKEGVQNGILTTDQKMFSRELAAKRFEEHQSKAVKEGNVTIAQMLELAGSIASGDYKTTEKIMLAFANG